MPMFRALSDRTAAVLRRGREWAERQDPGSPSGVAISAWRHYRSIEGPLQSALLSLYILVAVLPALLGRLVAFWRTASCITSG